MWGRLFLSVAEVTAFLDWADAADCRPGMPYLPAMLTAAARTGARLGERARSRPEDWDWARGVLVLRE